MVYSENEEDHYKHLETTISRLKEKEVYTGRNKCSFKGTGTELLGLNVSREGIRIGSGRVKIVREWPKPGSISGLRSFLGLLKSFRRFLKGFLAIAASLTNLTRNHKEIKM